MSDAMAHEFHGQADVDQAFADYDTLLRAARGAAVPVDGGRVRCVGCGSTAHCFNNSGGHEPGLRHCVDCGVVQPGAIIFETMYGRSLPTRSSNYKRIHHWHERISQLLLMESRIPMDHMLAIAERLLDGSHTSINKDSIRAVLRSLGLQVYIEKWLQIIHRCTDIAPPAPGPVLLQKLDTLFLELQRPFSAKKTEVRRNFLNYNYVFCRLFQKLHCAQYCMFFPLIRSKHKLKCLDDMWSEMATSLGWEVPPLQVVAPFSVQVQRPADLLHRLRVQAASSALAAPQTAPVKTVFRTWGHHQSTRPRKRPITRHSRPPAQKPQTLVLQLKRRRCSSATAPP